MSDTIGGILKLANSSVWSVILFWSKFLEPSGMLSVEKAEASCELTPKFEAYTGWLIVSAGGTRGLVG